MCFYHFETASLHGSRCLCLTLVVAVQRCLPDLKALFYAHIFAGLDKAIQIRNGCISNDIL